jgi:signal peptidase II
MLDPQPVRAPEAPSEAPSTSLRSRIAGRWRNDALFFAIAITIVVVDQITKSIVRENLRVGESWPEGWEFIRIIHVTNSGAAFGILQDQTTFLIITSTLGLAAIVLYYIYPPMDHGLIRVALGMQLGGAVGNLIDRVRLGEVTDFVDVGQFPTFNVADSSISISITAVLIFFLFQEIDRPKPSDTIHAAGDD